MSKENTTDFQKKAMAASPVEHIVNCNCDMRTKLVGDGCMVCNPEYWEDHKAYTQGSEARHQGLTLVDNPYGGTRVERSWVEGWEEANADIMCS